MAAADLSLADLAQDGGGVIPADLVLEWNAGEKSAARNARLLEPYRARGTIVSSDSAGLSSMTRRYALAQVLKLVSEPKEIIHSLGVAIGGEAVGVWAADNTLMFYPDPIDPSRVTAQMLAAQRRVKALAVQIGLGIHVGECFRIAGGLFGAQAEWIEAIAEDCTSGGEIVVSGEVHARIGGGLGRGARLRADLAARGEVWSLADDGAALDVVEGEEFHYALPFDSSFFERLRATPLDALAGVDFTPYRSTRTVAFVARATRPREHLLEALTDMSLFDSALRRAATAHGGDVVKSTGSIGIVLFEGGSALPFARGVVEASRQRNIGARVGVARGEVFVFSLDGGGRDIAGHPVNVGSKLSEDSGLDGILVDSSAVLPGDGPGGRPYRVTLSRVELTGVRFAV